MGEMKMNQQNNHRRQFLMKSLGATAAVFAGAKIAEAACVVSAAQTSGPFIPDDFPFRATNEGRPYIQTDDSNADLTWINGNVGPDGKRILAQGQILYVRGLVQDQNCQAVSDANVYLWQADENGHYNHEEDPNVKSIEDLDQNFQYRGFVKTDAQGHFQFKTIKPKYYPLDESGTQLRTAHFHVAVLHPKCRPLTTQTYFEGDALEDIQRIRQLNQNDIILSPTGKIRPELKNLIVEYKVDPRVTDGLVGNLILSVQRIG
jgi:protocatechuate 3,4-dioxygenase beta subunit